MTYFMQALLIDKHVWQSRICLLRQVLGKYRCYSTVYAQFRCYGNSSSLKVVNDIKFWLDFGSILSPLLYFKKMNLSKYIIAIVNAYIRYEEKAYLLSRVISVNSKCTLVKICFWCYIKPMLLDL